MASIYSLGCLFGAIVAFLMADSLGRKGSVGFGSWVVLIGTILQTSTTGKTQMIVSRFISGIGIGMITVNVPIWQAESFKSHNRGVCIICDFEASSVQSANSNRLSLLFRVPLSLLAIR